MAMDVLDTSQRIDQERRARINAVWSVDAVFAHQSVHHVERLEALYATVRDALRPDAVFHLHEFVGPSRFQWSDAQLRLVNGLLDELPARLRRLPSGAAKPEVPRPTV